MVDDQSISLELYRTFKEAIGCICPICGGSGKIKAMQGMAVFDGGSIRGPDTWMVCLYCKGGGKLPKG